MPKGGHIAALRNLAEFLKGSHAPRKVYHGTLGDIQEFTSSPIWLTSSRKAAGEFADRQAFGERSTDVEDYRELDEWAPQFERPEPQGQNVMPLYASIKNPLDLTDMGAANTLEEAIGELQKRGFLQDIDESNFSDVTWEIAGDLSTEDIAVEPDTTFVPTYRILEALDVYRDIREAGYDGVKIVDTDIHGAPIEAWAAFEPTQVKSAVGNIGTFDPREPDITKAKGGSVRSAFDELRRTLRDNPEFAAWFKESQAVDPEGNPLRVFHGAGRADRFEAGIKPERATSGPMPFFTDDPEIASNYAIGKQDTSLEDTGYEHWFTYKPKGSRTSQPLSRMWYDMTPAQRADFNARMRHIGENEDTGEIEDQSAVGGGIAPSHWDWLISRENSEHRGNGLSAAVDMWLQSGNLFNQEEKFLDVLKAAGLDLGRVDFTDIKHGSPGVLPVYLSAQRPLVTSAIPPEVVEALQEAADRQRRYAPSEREFLRGVDPWDKEYRDPDVWMDELRKGIESSAAGGNPGHAWTSIPDWVTKTLQDLGYDSIRDVGGKMGGEGHDVWIPFEPTQIKSAVGNVGTFDPTKRDITKAKGGSVRSTVDRAMQELREYQQALAPQRGFFSTLDQLIEQAPFERADAEQWLGYLKPGRMLKREGMEFPLKKEELEYTILPWLKDPWTPALRQGFSQSTSLTKAEVLDRLRKSRPTFGRSASVDDTSASVEAFRRTTDETKEPRTSHPISRYGPSFDPRLSHQTPGSSYQESTTTLADLSYPGHFRDDTLSHSRTSVHAIKGERNEAGHLLAPGRIRLVEEIQSDLHQDAAERTDDAWGHMSREERERYESLTARSTDFNLLPKTDANLEARRAIDRERNALWAEVAKRRPRRGYRDEFQIKQLEYELAQVRAERDEIRNQLKDDDSFDPELKQWREIQDAVNSLKTRIALLQEGVPDAPFKEPAEYGRLELRKQLLNAVNNDEDYLALTRPEDQIERYGMDADSDDARAMHHVYGKVYLSEMERLARQYGAEMVEVPLKVHSEEDIRPRSMRALEAENMSDFLDSVERGNYYGTGDPYIQVIDEIYGKLDERGRRIHASYLNDAYKAVLRWNEVRMTEDDTTDALPGLVESMERLWHAYTEFARSTTSAHKTFPAIKLTPEVRERIKRVGVPLWTIGAAAPAVELLQQEQEEQPEEFQSGGPVVRPPARTDLEYLRAVTDSLANQVPFISPETRSELSDTLLRPLGGFASQWMALNEEGNPTVSSLPLFTISPTAGLSAYVMQKKMGMHPTMAPPGLVTETIALPADFMDIYDIARGQQPSDDSSGISRAAQEASTQLREAMMRELALDEPSGFSEHLLESLGIMAGQLPVGGLPAIGAKAPLWLKRSVAPLSAATEWFSPTIVPKPQNYLMGAGFGGAFGTGTEMLAEHYLKQDPWYLAEQAVRAGELSPELAFAIANKLAPPPVTPQDDLSTDDQQFIHSFLPEEPTDGD